MEKIEDIVMNAVREILGKPVDMDEDISNIPEWDSLKHLQIILEIEERTGKRIPMEKISGIKSIRDIIRILNEDDA